MEEVLSKELRAGLNAARISRVRKASRLRLDLDGRLVPVLRLGKSGFAVAIDDAPSLPGLVDLYDGARHLFQCLIVASEESGGEMWYEFKRATPVAAAAPLDFELSEWAPAGLITKQM